MVMGKSYLAVFFALALFAFVGLGVASGAGGGNIGIMGSTPKLDINLSYPVDGYLYNLPISNFNWALLSNTSALISCNYTLNGARNSFDCSLASVNISSVEGYNELNLSILSGDMESRPSINFTVDTIPPQFSALNESPASLSTYASGQFYEFSADVSDAGVGVGSVWYEFDGANYTDVYNSGSTYYFNRSDLAAGSYSYEWFASDTLGNTNSSGDYTYVVNKADPTPNMSIVGDDNITYGEYTDFVGAESNSGDGGCNYSLTPSNDTLFGAGVVVFTLTAGGCANYTAGSITRNLTVLQAAPVLTFLANGGTANLTLTYGGSANISASAGGVIAGNVVTVGLDRDGVSVLGENGLDVVLAGNKTYSYRANITGNQNYSDVGYQYLDVTVNRAASTTSLSVNPASPIVYGAVSNFSCSNSAGLLIALYSNGSDISAERGLDVVRAAGNYSLNCTASESENYTGSSDSLSYEIDRVVPSLSLAFSPSSSVNSGTETNASGLGCPSQLTCKLYRDGNETNNSDVSTLGAGLYSYEFNTTGNENYTNASITGSLTVTGLSSKGGGGSSHKYFSCYSDWTCSNWSICDRGLQTRICSLIDSGCFSSGNKPNEAQGCILSGGLNDSESNFSETPIREIINSEPEIGGVGSAGITGGVIGALSSGGGLAIAAFVAIVLLAYGYTIIRKRRFQNSLEKTLAEAK